MPICRSVGAIGGLLALHLALSLSAQEPARPLPTTALQPLAQQARRLETALRYLGEPLADADRRRSTPRSAAGRGCGVRRIQQVLDRRVLVRVHINPESRVRVEQGAARPDLVQGGTRLFLVKVLNDAGVTAPLVVQSPNIGRVYVPPRATRPSRRRG